MKCRALQAACFAGLLLSQAIMAKPSQAAWYDFLLPFVGGSGSRVQSRPQSQAKSHAQNKNRAIAAASPVTTPAARPATSGLMNGRFKGDLYDVYYGYVQVRADISKGKLVRIDILHYPSDRRTSRIIASQALPVLKQEAISAQSANIDVVSGATLTSEGFIESLAGALIHARGRG